jgi:hypothetical protein
VRQIEACRVALFTALGLAPGCGGQTMSQDGSPARDGSPPARDGSSPVRAEAGPIATDAEAPVPDRDLGGGFVLSGGWLHHRPVVGVCDNRLRPATSEPQPLPDGVFLDGGPATYCRADTDCTDAAHGRCEIVQEQTRPYPYADFQSVLACIYGCETDTDCLPGEICECGEAIGRCVAASCTSDASCTEGELCAPVWSGNDCESTPNWRIYHYRCQSPGSECGVDAACPDSSFSCCSNGNWFHASRGCGRPFLVAGEARLSAPVPRSDFAHAVDPRLTDLPDQVRAALSRAWARVGLLEHASVAAFARFTLELLSLGAPPDLLIESQQALADELEHTRLAFGLASAYGNAPVGPGALQTRDALAGSELIEIAVTTFLEGCIGETCAAAEAAVARDAARDDAVRDVLARIADDELRHAALAYRFLRWALETRPASERASIADRIERELRTALEVPPHGHNETDGFDLTEHGVLPRAAHDAIRSAVLRRVVAPCTRALLGDPSESGRGASAPAEADCAS